MPLSKLSELIQNSRDKPDIVQVLLKSFLMLTSGDHGLDSDSTESAGDILSLLTATISSLTPSDAKKATYLEVCLNVLNRVRNFAAEARPVSQKLITDMFETIRSMVPTENDLNMIFEDSQRR